MPLFDPNTPMSLEDVLGNQAKLKSDQSQAASVQKKRRLVSREAATGRLGSGVSNYPLADLAVSDASGLGDIQGGLAGALGQIPGEDYLNTNENARKRRLAELMGDLNKPSDLEQALGALNAAGNIGATFAAFM